MKLLFLALLLFASCNYKVEVSKITKMRFIPPKHTKEKELVLQGAKLTEFKKELKCKKASYIWKGGYAMEISFSDGTKEKISGLSFYGRFIRFNRKFVCVISDKGYKSLFEK